MVTALVHTHSAEVQADRRTGRTSVVLSVFSKTHNKHPDRRWRDCQEKCCLRVRGFPHHAGYCLGTRWALMAKVKMTAEGPAQSIQVGTGFQPGQWLLPGRGHIGALKLE